MELKKSDWGSNSHVEISNSRQHLLRLEFAQRSLAGDVPAVGVCRSRGEISSSRYRRLERVLRIASFEQLTTASIQFGVMGQPRTRLARPGGAKIRGAFSSTRYFRASYVKRLGSVSRCIGRCDTPFFPLGSRLNRFFLLSGRVHARRGK